MVTFRVFHIYDSFPEGKRDVVYGLIRRLCSQQAERVRRYIPNSKGQEVMKSSKGQDGMQLEARQWQPHQPGPPRPSGYSID